MTQFTAGSAVRLRSSGRVGEILVNDGSELPCKVSFPDDLLPQADWFKEDALEPLVERDTALESTTNLDACCPICFAVTMDTAVVTPCQHIFCAACIEHVMVTSGIDNPTQTQCPMCRADVSLFNLRTISDGQLLHNLASDLSALAGLVFADATNRTVGFGSLHFEDAARAFVNYASPTCPTNFMKLNYDDGSELAPCHYFEEASWHRSTRTFHGLINWAPKTRAGSSAWRYVVQFSECFNHVSGGSVAALLQAEDCLLDGKWRIEWEHGETAIVDISGGMWELMGVTYHLDLANPMRPSFSWPGFRTTQSSSTDIRNTREVGSRLVWTTDHPQYPTISWVRLEAVPEGPASRIQPLGPRGWQYVRLYGLPAQVSLYCPGTIWGNCFVQGNSSLGLASYHFGQEGAEDDTYISYEHAGCSRWPALDNGAPLPARATFTDVEWIGDSRLFKGTINWVEIGGATWQGIERAQYEMVFDERFMFISIGCCRQIFPNGIASSELYHFGEDLVYINCAAKDQLLRKREAGETWEAVRASYADQRASGRTLAVLRRAWFD